MILQWESIYDVKWFYFSSLKENKENNQIYKTRKTFNTDLLHSFAPGICILIKLRVFFISSLSSIPLLTITFEVNFLQENRVTQRDLRSHSNHKLRSWWSSMQAASSEISAELVCWYFKASDARESNIKTWFLLHKIHRARGGRRSWKRQVHRFLDDGPLSTRKANEERKFNDPTEGARWWKCKNCWKITAVNRQWRQKKWKETRRT